MRLTFDEFNKNFFHNKQGLILSCTKVSKHELSSSELIDRVLEPDSCNMETKITVYKLTRLSLTDVLLRKT